MADPTISHGWVTAEPDAGKDVDADNLNDHVITGFNAAVDARVAAEAALARNADNLTSGTVADARIAATIARDSEVTSAVSTHAGDTDPHGDRADAASQVATHSADTTAVHGIADTAAVVLTGDARLSDARTPTAHKTSHEDGGADEISLTGLAGTPAALTTHEAATNPHAVYLTPAEGDAAYDAIGAAAAAVVTAAADVDAHEADTTSVHGISNTANLYAAGGTDVAVVDGGTGASTASGARTNLGLVIGTDVPGQAAFDDHSARHEDGGADEISIAGLAGTPTELTTHLNDTSAAHAASAIGFTPNGSIAATDVQAAIQEVRDEASTGFTIGTSMPGSPATNQLIFRTDLGMMFQYDGTRWLCTCPHTIPVYMQHLLLPMAAGNSQRANAPQAITADIWMTTLDAALYVVTTNNGSNYWTINYGAVTFNTSANAANTLLRKSANINAVFTIATGIWYQVDYVLTGAPGTLYPLISMGFRYIGT